MIDAHAHVWDLSRAGYTWPDASVPSIHRSMSLRDLAPTLDELGIDGVVLVQAADLAVDTENMLAEAAAEERVRGVVGWADLGADAVTFDNQLADLLREPIVVGLRNLMHVKGERGWILGAQRLSNVAAVAAAGLPLDVVTSDHTELPDIVRLQQAVPGLTVIVDHLGKPPIGGTAAARREWRAVMADIASDSAATAKLSGLSSAVGRLDDWTPAQVTPFIEDALELFGPERLMFGGDWPVITLAGGYVRAWRVIDQALSSLGSRERAAVLGGTAARVYGL